MRVRGRRVVRSVMAVLLALGLIGCSQSKGPELPPVELKLINRGHVPTEALKSIVDGFRAEHPNVKVTIYGPSDRPVPPNQAAPYEGIDLLLVTFLQMMEMGRDGILRELPTLRLPVMEGALPEVADAISSVNGRRLGLPIGLSPLLVAAKEKELGAAGIPLPPLDWSWTDYEQLATQAVQDGRPARLDAAYLVESTLRAYGGRVWDEDRATWVIGASEAAPGLAQLARFAERKILKIDRIPEDPSTNLFFIDLWTHETPAGTVRYPLPRGPQGRPTPVNGILASIPTGAAQPEMAQAFINFLGTKGAQLHLARAGIRPVTADQEVLAAYRQAAGDRLAEIWELVVNDLYVEATPVYLDRLSGSLAPYLRGEQGLDAVIADLNRQMPK